MFSRVVIALAALGVLAGLALKFWPADVRQEHAALVEDVLTAFERDDYELFQLHADRGLSKLRREEFALLAGQHADRLKHGHTLDYLGASERSGVRQTRWRIIFKDGGAAVPLTLGVRDGRVAMISFR